MRPVVVNDASCLIDLCKGDLLSVLGNLPYRLVVPLPVREFEILDFTDAHWHALDAAGLVTYDLSPRHEIANRLDRLLSLDRKCGPPRLANGEIQEREQASCRHISGLLVRRMCSPGGDGRRSARRSCVWGRRRGGRRCRMHR